MIDKKKKLKNCKSLDEIEDNNLLEKLFNSKKFKKILKNNINFTDLKNKRILDIGFFNENMLKNYINKGAIIFGIKSKDSKIDLSKYKNLVYQDDFSKELIERIYILYGQFDVILITDPIVSKMKKDELLDILKIITKKDTILLFNKNI